MSMRSMTLAAFAGIAAASAAQAFITFGFAPPANAFNPEVFYNDGDESGPGTVTFDESVFIDLIVDASIYGGPSDVQTFTTTLTMDLTVGQVGASGAPVTGTFRFTVGGEDILIGTVGPNGGRMTGFAGAGALLFSNTDGGSFSLEHAGVLTAFLPLGFEFNAGRGATFGLTNVFNSGINESGYYESFIADAALVGYGRWIIPAPGPTCGVMIVLLSSTGRRRRTE